MWICNRPFRYRGVNYKPGDQVPAETWPGRKALVSMRKLRQVTEPGREVVATKPVDIKSLKRPELNAYATEQGIENPEGYSSKESLIEAINALNAPLPTEDETPPVETEVQLPESEEVDSLWSDDTNEPDESNGVNS